MTVSDENRHSLGSRVYHRLEDAILSGTYPIGASLTELGLCSDLGVSRTPVRDALARLEQEGLVRLIPNKGAVVLGIGSSDLVDIYRMRMRLEGLAASMAADTRTAKDLETLRDIVELSEFYVARGDAHRLRDLDSDFHEAVYLAGGSRMLSSTLSALHRKIGAYRALSLTDPGRVPDSVREHREIFDAIERKDASAADCLAARHVESALNNLLRLLPPRKTI